MFLVQRQALNENPVGVTYFFFSDLRGMPFFEGFHISPLTGFPSFSMRRFYKHFNPNGFGLAFLIQ